MGRKKRKTNDDDDEPAVAVAGDQEDGCAAPLGEDKSASPPPGARIEDPGGLALAAPSTAGAGAGAGAGAPPPPPSSSGYAVTSHSGEVVHEDVYVSDGSEDSEDGGDRPVEILLVNSRNGIMRRGMGGMMMMPNLLRPNRQWVRGGGEAEGGGEGEGGGNQAEADTENGGGGEEDGGGGISSNPSLAETLAGLDPAQRAARLLQEKQRKQELERMLKRQREAEENAGRDPTLFSKRTAFDIRFDQIEDKPWLRGSGELADFFNYDFQEEDWLEYSTHQLQIRHELIDAARAKRPVDQTIVPVVPKIPSNQAPRVAVAAAAGSSAGEAGAADDGGPSDVAGPELPPPAAPGATAAEAPPEKAPPEVDAARGYADLKVVGGAWGAVEGSKLAKLIEEQEKHSSAVGVAVAALDAAMGGAGNKKSDDGPGGYSEEGGGRGQGGGDDEGDYGDDRFHRDSDKYDRAEDEGSRHRDSRNAPRSDYSRSERRNSSRYGEDESRRNDEDASGRHRRGSGGRDDAHRDSRRRDDRREWYGGYGYDPYGYDPYGYPDIRDHSGARQYEDAPYGSYYGPQGGGGVDPGLYRTEYYDGRSGYYESARHYPGRDDWYPRPQDNFGQPDHHRSRGAPEDNYRAGAEENFQGHEADFGRRAEASSSKRDEEEAKKYGRRAETSSSKREEEEEEEEEEDDEDEEESSSAGRQAEDSAPKEGEGGATSQKSRRTGRSGRKRRRHRRGGRRR
jgi:hypothetical protein